MPYGLHGGGWGVFWMIASWVLIVAIVVFVVRAFSGGSPERSEPDRSERAKDPRTILDERFARGEISEGEYRDRAHVLEETRR